MTPPSLVPELYCSAMEVSVDFYTRLLGFEEERWYRRGNEEVGNRQFVVQDPDGYLLRMRSDLGRRAFIGTVSPKPHLAR